MAEETASRSQFISKIGTFFIVISLFAIIIFIASDVSRNDPGRKAGATKTYIAESVHALQTRAAGSKQAALEHKPTPTLIPIKSANDTGEVIYYPAFCFGAIGLLVGWFFKRISAGPPAPSKRFEAIRKMQQKQREDKARKEGEKQGKKDGKKEAEKKK
jgi:hypothetical protein